jgi:Leucine zipper
MGATKLAVFQIELWQVFYLSEFSIPLFIRLVHSHIDGLYVIAIYHRMEIVTYSIASFAQCLSTFLHCCSRLTEDTYTVDEVNDMIDGLLTSVRGEVDSELIHTGHTNVLLLVQLFRQAEKWHLKLQADVSELENRSVTCTGLVCKKNLTPLV